ncbi:uncharacterized protein LOC115626222 [Scaptodrosophila lebanonensis]|uniref:Uncharacterized protein LOC115626222 n=1 Tax=Drosophila lebanonensis TaxID=7225 RepID=A0A6J2TLC0_DROLE|nr:uncharacterized protein LOC115626222 [Scaptodrosophila lebanonensis]
MSHRAHEIRRIENKIKEKTPHRAFREITFDRQKVRESIVPLTYNEARRIRGPIYEALQDELFREGCQSLPAFLYCLAEKEQALYETVSIRARIIDDRPLLNELIDKLKRAELAIVQYKLKGYKESFTLFYETLMLLQPYRHVYEYALVAVMEKIVSLCHSVDGEERDAAEMIARIYYIYALYLESVNQRPTAITYLQMTLELVRGHVWGAEPDMPPGCLMMHELVSQKLARQLLILGKQIVRQKPDEAIELARKATVLIAEIGREKNLEIFCDTFLERSSFLMESGNFTAAKQCLEQIKPRILALTEYKFVKLNIKYYLFMGQCSENFQRPEEAIVNYKKALRLSRIYDHRDHEAEILLALGKIFAKDTHRLSLAKRCYEQAKNIYIDFNDIYRKKTAVYLMAKLKADEITPLYMAMLKASQSRYCAFFNLRQWKNRCRPFWKRLGDELIKQETDHIYCLLDEEKEDVRSESDDYVVMNPGTFQMGEGDIC